MRAFYTEQIVPVGLVTLSWKKDATVSHKCEGSRWYMYCLGIFFSVKVLVVPLNQNKINLFII